MEWISIKDKMPETLQRVLTYSSNKEMNVGYWQSANNYWYCEVNENSFDADFALLYYVTHWMPLPEAPSENIVYGDEVKITKTSCNCGCVPEKYRHQF